ncbi:ABC transporter [Vairimorpha necatrix]|uniref:ABC transporter n=1 Tax=Vairimorpha necatrix TaxID=6039 RepID=A0AAX4JFE4_9MICR
MYDISSSMEKDVKSLEFENLCFDESYVDSFVNVRYTKIIRSLSGKIESGKLTAVLGSNGSGKTHFLRMLIGDINKNDKTFGKILYNGKERDPEYWRFKFSYVPQDDLFYPQLSIYEHMIYYVLHGDVQSYKLDEENIDEILTRCGMLHKKHSSMKDLSEFECKKALIAISMINNPEILFLDEPTTGLDLYMALDIVCILKNYAQENNCMVICTLHYPAPELFMYFDDLIVLVIRGVFYIGPYSRVESFLIDNGIQTKTPLTLSDLLLVLSSAHSIIPLPKKYRQHCKNIVEKNKINNANYPTIACNNYKKLNFCHNYLDIWKIIKLKIKTSRKFEFGSVKNVFIFVLYIFTLFFDPIIDYIGSRSLVGKKLYEELKFCSYNNILSIGFAIVNQIFFFTPFTWMLQSLTNLPSENFYFSFEYLDGRYTFGTYFIAVFFCSLVKNFIFFLSSLVFVCYFTTILCFSLLYYCLSAFLLS